jgi:hypothetical protein
MTLFLDFDRTLFDTERLYARLGASLLLPFLTGAESFEELLYPDTLPFLRAHAKDDLVLVTRGIPALQRLKAEKSGVLRRVSHALYVSEGTKALAITKHLSAHLLREPAYFIDDMPEELAAVRDAHPRIQCVRMRRPTGRTSLLPGPHGIPEVRDLAEFSNQHATAERKIGLS